MTAPPRHIETADLDLIEQTLFRVPEWASRSRSDETFLPHRGQGLAALARVRAALAELEIQQREAAELVRDLKGALARERGGGTPLDRMSYILLNDMAREFLAAVSSPVSAKETTP